MSLSRLYTRMARLEARQLATAAHPPRSVVVWDDDPLPDDLRAHDLVVRLVRKAESVEAWERQCRERFPRALGDTAAIYAEFSEAIARAR